MANFEIPVQEDRDTEYRTFYRLGMSQGHAGWKPGWIN